MISAVLAAASRMRKGGARGSSDGLLLLGALRSKPEGQNLKLDCAASMLKSEKTQRRSWSVLSIRGFLCHAPRGQFALGGGLGVGRAPAINPRGSEEIQKRAPAEADAFTPRRRVSRAYVSREPKMVNSKLTNRSDHAERKNGNWNAMADFILFWTLLAVIAANSLLVAIAVLNVRRASK